MRDPGGKGTSIFDRTSSAPRHGIRVLRRVAAVAAITATCMAAPSALASPMPSQLPGAPSSAAPEGSGLPAQPVATAPAAPEVPAAVTPAATTPSDALRFGARGSDVRALQRKLRTRGIKVPVDGRYGRTTRAGVRILQRKLKVRATGVADAALLRRLGIKIRAVASTPATLSGPTTARFLKAFPVLGEYRYFDDFGAPRHQGAHQGIDIVAKMGTPLVACVDGTVIRLTRQETGLGGIYIWIQDAQGNQYYYAHMQTIAAEISAGTRVTAGQVVGTMGMTGDARGTIPHLHFEIRPRGGGSINPFSDLRAVDPKRR